MGTVLGLLLQYLMDAKANGGLIRTGVSKTKSGMDRYFLSTVYLVPSNLRTVSAGSRTSNF